MIEHTCTKSREELSAELSKAKEIITGCGWEIERIKSQRDELKGITTQLIEKLQWTLGECGMSEKAARNVPAIKKVRAIIAKIEASK